MNSTKIKENLRFNYQSNFGKNNPLLTNTALYDAALNEFVKSNYQNASLNHILKNAKMPKSSFYYQYGDKLGLYLTMMDVIVQRKLTFFNERVANVDMTADFFTVLRQLSKETMDFMFLDKRMYQFSNMIMYEDHELLKVMIKYFPYDIKSSFGPLLEKAYTEKQIDQKYPLEFVNRVLSVVLSSFDKLIDEKTTPEESYKVLTLVFDILENGIKE